MRPLDEPYSSPVLLRGFRTAALERWGPRALRIMAKLLPEELRRAAIDMDPSPRVWVPERYTITWAEAAFHGLCEGDEALFKRYVDRMVELSFGRVRRLVLRVVDAPMLLERSGDMWRTEHSHGRMRGRSFGRGRGVIVLYDHPYTETRIASMAIAEGLRFGVSLSRGTYEVEETHRLSPEGALEVELFWR